MRRYKNNEPKQMRAKFDSKCAETGKAIKKGDIIVYYPDSKKAYCEESKQAYEFRNWQADLAMGYDY